MNKPLQRLLVINAVLLAAAIIIFFPRAPVDSTAPSAGQPTARPFSFVTQEPSSFSSDLTRSSFSARPTAAPKSSTNEYVLNTNSKVFHKPSCSSVRQMKDSNKRYYTGTRQQVISMGYRPCQRCNPK